VSVTNKAANVIPRFELGPYIYLRLWSQTHVTRRQSRMPWCWSSS